MRKFSIVFDFRQESSAILAVNNNKSMKTAQFKDYTSIYHMMTKTVPQQTTDTLAASGQLQEKGITFNSKDTISLSDITFDLYFVLDEVTKTSVLPTTIFENLSDVDKTAIGNFLSEYIEDKRKYKWSGNYTSFMSIEPPFVNYKGIIAVLVLMGVLGSDKKYQNYSYSVGPLLKI